MRAVDAHSNPMLGWIVRIVVETGMRSDEILGLRLSQVDLKRRTVRLSDTKNDSARTVPLTRSGLGACPSCTLSRERLSSSGLRRFEPV